MVILKRLPTVVLFPSQTRFLFSRLKYSQFLNLLFISLFHQLDNIFSNWENFSYLTISALKFALSLALNFFVFCTSFFSKTSLPSSEISCGISILSVETAELRMLAKLANNFSCESQSTLEYLLWRATKSLNFPLP